MRRVVNQLGLLCEVGTVAELQTRRLVPLEPVIKVVEEMAPALAHITGEELERRDQEPDEAYDEEPGETKAAGRC